jgi:hypothetical protein
MSAATKELVAAAKAKTSLKLEDLDARQHSMDANGRDTHGHG